jgi:hypothetical protein
MDMSEELISISEVCKMLNRRPNTVRGWDREGILPDHLKSTRMDNGWRGWTASQVEGLRQWLLDTDRRPGKGLPNYQPTEEEREKHVTTVRRKRTKSVLLEND